MRLGADHEVRVHIHVLGLEVKDVVSPDEVPPATEAGTEVDHVFVGVQLDLGGDPKASADLVDGIGEVVVFLHDLRMDLCGECEEACDGHATERLSHGSLPATAGSAPAWDDVADAADRSGDPMLPVVAPSSGNACVENSEARAGPVSSRCTDGAAA